jgi:hypothetical protein
LPLIYGEGQGNAIRRLKQEIENRQRGNLQSAVICPTGVNYRIMSAHCANF